MKSGSKELTHNFQPSQIVCLEYDQGCLFAEVIQVISSRQMCWVRPLMLKVVGDFLSNENLQIALEETTVWDLREGADLVWPMSLFRGALDTEVVPLLVELNSPESPGQNLEAAHQQLKAFINKVWQAYPSVFQEIE